MSTSRPTLARRALGLAAAPALLVALAACGDDDDSGGDSASGSGSGDFCQQAESLSETFEEIDNPTSQQFADALDRIDPPEAIADDWNRVISALEGIEDIDPENPDPEALAALETPEVAAAGDRVDEYLSEECDIGG
jgi:hypothetical protein